MPEHIRADCMMSVKEAERLRRIEAAAREVVGETVIIRNGEFATFEGHWVQVEKYAVEALRSSLGEKVDG
jgi:hypothetical protein